MLHKTKTLVSRKTICLLLFVCFPLLVIFFSCRKADLSNAAQPDKADRFFKTSASNKEVLRVMEQLKKQNSRTGFVNALPAHAGNPVWKKIVIRAGNRATRGEGDSIEQVIIPLTYNNQNLSSIIIADRQADSSYIIGYYDDIYVYQATHSPALSAASSEAALALFLYMENRTFGTTAFYHIPAGIFENPGASGNAPSEKALYIENTAPDTGVTNLVACFVVKYCDPGDICQPMMGYCDRCPRCPWVYYCVNNDPPPGIPGSGGEIPPASPNPSPPSGGGSGGSTCSTCPLPPVECRLPFYVENPCGTVPPVEPPLPNTDSIIKKLLHDDNVAIKKQRDSVWAIALQDDEEYHFFIKKYPDTTRAIGITTDHDPDAVTPDKIVQLNSDPDGDYHTHQDHPDERYRHPHDPQDISESNGRNRKLYYRSYVDCGDTLYVVVNEKLSLIKDFFRSKNQKQLQELPPWSTLSYQGINRRSVGIAALKSFLGLSSIFGFGLYKSINADKTEFIKIN